MTAVSKMLMDSLKSYARNIPEVKHLYPEAIGAVIEILEKRKVPPAVWVAIGDTLSDEGVYRMLEKVGGDVIEASFRRNELQPTANATKVS